MDLFPRPLPSTEKVSTDIKLDENLHKLVIQIELNETIDLLYGLGATQK